MLVWNETDVLTVLEVVPEIEADQLSHIYSTSKNGIKLEITIFQYDGDVRFELTNETNGSSIFTMQIMDCDGVLRKIDKTGEYLEFAPAKCFGGRYDGVTSIPYGVRVSVHPDIQVSLYG